MKGKEMRYFVIGCEGNPSYVEADGYFWRRKYAVFYKGGWPFRKIVAEFLVPREIRIEPDE